MESLKVLANAILEKERQGKLCPQTKEKLENIITMVEYQIKDKEGIVFGRFSNKEDRDKALKHLCFGFPCEEE